MNKKTIMALTIGASLLAGCAAPFSEKPTATNFQTEQQHKLQSVAHWQLVAQDTSAELVKALPTTKPALYVAQEGEQSAFQVAFNEQLISSLVAAGFPVVKQQVGNVLTVNVKAVPVRFSDSGRRTANAGEGTVLAGGLWVLRNIYSNVSPGAAMMGGAVSYDVYNYVNSEKAAGRTPKTELLVTTTVSDGHRYHASTSNAYYTTESDWYHYTTAKPVPKHPAKSFNLVGEVNK